MKYFSVLLAFIAVLLFSMAEVADAKRFGGSRSFGSKPSFSTNAPKAPSSNLNTGSTFNQRNTTNNQSNTAAGAAGAGTVANSSRGFGLMGGLLAGTLIGSMLFGTPFSGGGFFDILILGLLVYFGIRLVRGFLSQGQRNSQNSQYQGQNNYNNSKSENSWNDLRSEKNETTTSNYTSYQNQENSQQNTSNSIDEENAEFIEGAKALFVRMQASWDKRDLADIESFTTKAVFDEIKKQAEEDPKPSQTLILSLNAAINTKEKENEADRISVYFTALMREDEEQAMAENVTELWHFYRKNANSHWLLDGIQQI